MLTVKAVKNVGKSALAVAGALLGVHAWADNPTTVRVGYFPNVTHATAIIGFSPEKHTFYKTFPKVAFNNKLFNAGPAAVEALRANAIDLAYIGGGPAINAFGRGRDIVILANVANGGSLLVARAGSNITTVKDLAGKKVAVPQIANTQDVLLRYQLSLNRLRTTDKGGSVSVNAVENPDILALFKTGGLDAALVPEPWASRLEKEAGATVVLNAAQVFNSGVYPVTVLVARKDFADHNPQFTRAFVKASNVITADLAAHTQSYAPLLNSEVKRLSGKGLSDAIIRSALSRTRFTSRITQHDILVFANLVQVAGYQKAGVNLNGILWK